MDLLNERAKELGCLNTTFTNPHGLNDPNHKTSAQDLAIMARAAMAHPVFREIVGTRSMTIKRSLVLNDTDLHSKNKYLDLDRTADGIKTGWTVPAGHCYVGSATREGYRVITVVLGSENWVADNRALLDWSFAEHSRLVIAVPGDVVSIFEVAAGRRPDVRATVAAPLGGLVRDGDPRRIQVKSRPFDDLRAPIAEGQPIGEVVLSDDTGWTLEVSLVASEAIDETTPARHFAFFLLVCGVATGAYWLGASPNPRPRRRQARPAPPPNRSLGPG